jgi:prepilin-type N-terminal cleavage/methylation domain-containing protein
MNKGYTLIEVLISIVIFTLISGAAFAILTSTIKVQKYSLESQQLLGQTSYAVEYISRALRMAKRAENSDCIGIDTNYENPARDETKIKFLTYNNECVQFFLDGVSKQLKMRRNIGTVDEEILDLTSDNFEITTLRFEIVGEEAPPVDYLQPKITLFMEIKGKSSGLQPNLKIQTTISQRDSDF